MNFVGDIFDFLIDAGVPTAPSIIADIVSGFKTLTHGYDEERDKKDQERLYNFQKKLIGDMRQTDFLSMNNKSNVSAKTKKAIIDPDIKKDMKKLNKEIYIEDLNKKGFSATGPSPIQDRIIKGLKSKGYDVSKQEIEHSLLEVMRKKEAVVSPSINVELDDDDTRLKLTFRDLEGKQIFKTFIQK